MRCPGLLERAGGITWVDVAQWGPEAERLLIDVFGVHPLAIDACRQRNHVPTVHAYENHYFVTLHAPLLGAAGHVHLLELDQVVGRGFLVTVHGPINPAVEPEEAMGETHAVLRRIESGRFRPATGGEIS